jgi:hypothetical protein
MSITGYQLGEGLVEHMDRVAVPRKIVGTGIFSPKTLRTGFFLRRVILRTTAAKPCRSSGCDPPPSCVVSSLAPRGDLKLSYCWRLLPSSLRPPAHKHDFIRLLEHRFVGHINGRRRYSSIKKIQIGEWKYCRDHNLSHNAQPTRNKYTPSPTPFDNTC